MTGEHAGRRLARHVDARDAGPVDHRRRGEHRLERTGQAVNIAALDELAVGRIRDFRNASYARGHERSPARQRFAQDIRSAFGMTRKRNDVARAVPRSELGLRPGAGKMYGRAKLMGRTRRSIAAAS